MRPVLFLFVFILFVSVVNATEQNTVSRIIGDDVYSLIDSLDTEHIDLKHASYYADQRFFSRDWYNENFEQINQSFMGSISSYPSWEFVDFEDSSSKFKQQELIIIEGDFETYYDNNFVYDTKGEKLDPVPLSENSFPLYIIDSAGASSFREGFENEPLSYRLTKKGTLVAPDNVVDSRGFVHSFLCNLGEHENLGETYLSARREYYRNFDASVDLFNSYSESIGLVLKAYHLLGNPLAFVDLPNENFLTACSFLKGNSANVSQRQSELSERYLRLRWKTEYRFVCNM